MAETQTTIESLDQFEGVSGEYLRWALELTAAEKNQRAWTDDAEKSIRRFLDDTRREGPRSKLNLYHSNVITLRALLFGQLPSVDVSRRFNDNQDDVARVASEMMERYLNTDLDRDDDGFVSACKYALEDWTLTDLGVVRLRYEPGEAEEEAGQQAITREDPETGETTELAPAVPPKVVYPEEMVETDYVHWKDFRWSPARTWHEVRWVAFRVEMTRDDLKKRFGKKGESVPLMKTRTPDEKDGRDTAVVDAWARAEVWEIWDKEGRKVHWWAKGMDDLLDTKDDPYQLEEFFPVPRPLAANTTTTKWIPRPDFFFAKDLYDEIDELTFRIKQLERACKVRGAYDASEEALGRIFDEAYENELIPVKNWLGMQEKGGLNAGVQLLEIKPIAEVLQILNTQRVEKINLLFQVTGMSDIMRGQATRQQTAREASIKAGFASTRVQAMQDEIARFMADVQRVRAEMVAKHCSPETIAARANAERLSQADQQYVPQALQLIKDEFVQFRIAVRAETVALPDLAQQKQDAVEFIGALTQGLEGILPVVQVVPQAGPGLLRLLQWGLSKFKGAATIEGELDQLVDGAEKLLSAPKPPPPPDPKVEAEKVRSDATKFKAQADMMQTQQDMNVAQAEHGMEMQKMAAQAQIDRQKLANEVVRSQLPPRQPEVPLP